MALIKKVIFWVLGVCVGCSGIYYGFCKITNTVNPFTSLVDSIGAFIGAVFTWVATHIVAILIVLAIILVLLLSFFIIKKIKEKKDE